LRSNLYRLFDRLRTQLQLEPTPGEKGQLEVPRMILPVVDVLNTLATPRNITGTEDISGTVTSYIPYHTPPANTRWYVIWAHHGALSAASNGLAMQARSSSDAVQETQPGTGPTYLLMAPYIAIIDGPVEEGGDSGSFGMMGTGNGGDTSRGMTIHVLEFERERD